MSRNAIWKQVKHNPVLADSKVSVNRVFETFLFGGMFPNFGFFCKSQRTCLAKLSFKTWYLTASQVNLPLFSMLPDSPPYATLHQLVSIHLSTVHPLSAPDRTRARRQVEHGCSALGRAPGSSRQLPASDFILVCNYQFNYRGLPCKRGHSGHVEGAFFQSSNYFIISFSKSSEKMD